MEQYVEKIMSQAKRVRKKRAELQDSNMNNCEKKAIKDVDVFFGSAVRLIEKMMKQ